jgi:transposase-like protein
VSGSADSVNRKDRRDPEQDPDGESARQRVSMAIPEASRKWTMPVAGWEGALNRFAILFAECRPGVGNK